MTTQYGTQPINPAAHQVLSALADVAQRNREGRTQLASVLDRVREALHTERTEKAEALAEVDRLTALVATLEERNQHLESQNSMLTREVHTLAAAIQVANQEIHDSDAMLTEAMVAVQQEIAVSYPQAPRQTEAPRQAADPATQSLAAIERMLADSTVQARRSA